MTDAAIVELKKTDPEFRQARDFWAMIPSCDLRRSWRMSGQQISFRQFVINMAKLPEEQA